MGNCWKEPCGMKPGDIIGGARDLASKVIPVSKREISMMFSPDQNTYRHG